MDRGVAVFCYTVWLYPEHSVTCDGRGLTRTRCAQGMCNSNVCTTLMGNYAFGVDGCFMFFFFLAVPRGGGTWKIEKASYYDVGESL